MITITLAGKNVKELAWSVSLLGENAHSAFENALVEYLRLHEYQVTPPEKVKWETPSELAQRLRVSVKHICRKRQHPACPHTEVVRGKRGRVLYVARSERLDAFLTHNMKPKKNKPYEEIPNIKRA